MVPVAYLVFRPTEGGTLQVVGFGSEQYDAAVAYAEREHALVVKVPVVDDHTTP